MAPALSSVGSQAKYDDIPVLDLSGPIDEVCLQNMREAVGEWGCFRVVNHGIEGSLIQSADMVCRDVFKLPTEIKRKDLAVPPLYYARYIGGVAHLPFYESVGIDRVPNAEAIQKFSDSLWPHGNQKFCEVVEEYTSKMMEVTKRVQKVILESLGVGNYFESQFNNDRAVFRLNMYDVTSEPSPDCTGLPSHTDGNSITLLQEDEAGGFQLLKGGEWVDVKPIKHSLIVVAGDGFQAWSNGRVLNVKHRVMVKKRQSRLSMAFFSVFPEEMEIRAPPELIDEDHPQLYRPFQNREFIQYRMKNAKERDDKMLMTYAGIPLPSS